MQYNVYRREAGILQSFATQELAQAFIDSMSYNDIGLYIVYE